MITEFTILGERCSGTNYIEMLIIKNFNLSLICRYGRKHFFGFNEYNNSDHVLFIGIVRDPVEWIGSLYKDKFHLQPKLRAGWKSYITEEFWSYNDEIGPKKGREIMEDRNIYTKERYKDIFEARKTKCLFLLDDMPKKVKNYILIRYEDLLNDYQKVLEGIRISFNLTLNGDQYLNHTTYRKEKRIFRKILHRNMIPKEHLIYILGHLDMDIEERLGYKKLI